MRKYLYFWRYLRLRTQILLGLVLPATILALSAALIYFALEAAVRESAQAEESIRAISLRQALLNAILDAETGERGFAITGQEKFLAPYREATDNFERILADIRELDDDGETRRLDEVARLFAEWQEQIAEPVIRDRSESPGTQFSQGFAAYYLVRGVLERLDEGGALPDDEMVSTLMARVDEAAAGGLGGGTAQEWRRVLRFAEVFREAWSRADRDELLRRGRRLATALLPLIEQARRREARAAELVASGRGKALVDEMRRLVEASIRGEEARYRRLTERSREYMTNAEWFAVVLPPVAGALGLVLLLLMALDVIRAVRALRAGADDVASGRLTTQVRIDRVDELGSLAASFNEMARQLARRRDETRVLNAMQSMLGAARDPEEAYRVVERCCGRLLPGMHGAVYVIAPSRDIAECVASWGWSASPPAMFTLDECRAVRSGHVYQAATDSPELFCGHADPASGATLCVPLVSQDEMLGVLHVGRSEGGAIDGQERELATTVAEYLALELANLRLAERLRAQAIRDPLTGAFNRRYLEETLARELVRVARAGQALSLLAVDADHFKALNDRYGHGAGDLVLQKLVAAMNAGVRYSDIVCRAGGEEFVIVLPDADAATARDRAESLRERVENMQVQYRGQSVEDVTVSVGVAVFPAHGTRAEALMRAADVALYRAKREGRNRVVLHEAERDTDDA
ncbi:GAF sensor-containing diguanylate cyclase [Salinisphaera sp. PC39]|uniref:diguanylate cyclase n=1 Tax=Salinisphaera sp. PC39 TaxID=1304156 RepID=UPI00333F7AD3